MNYEMKYKEALERARTWREKSGMPADRKGILDDIFPELNETEDERIRREIIEFLNYPHPSFVGKRIHKDWIAWLEKQGDNKESGDECPELKESEDERIRQELIEQIAYIIPNNDEVDNEGNALPSYQERIDKYRAWLERQKEPDWVHHCVDLSDCSEEYRKAYYDGWNNCNMQHSQKENEDNCVIRCLLNYFNNVRYNENVTWGTDKFHMKVADIIKWLEEQKTFNEVTEECERMLCEHLKEKYKL